MNHPDKAQIARHKTALRRSDLSLPMKCLQRDGLLTPETPLLDYGCGRGEDIRLLEKQGVPATGWDPFFRDATPPQASDIVNLGYVINVIEDPAERAETLRHAWSLCGKLLSVSAQILVQGRGTSAVPFNDGVITRLGTFQKFFSQDELHRYIEHELGNEAVPAAPGVFFVFRDETLRQEWLARRYRRPQAAPKKRLSEQKFEIHREILNELMSAVTLHGRLPEPDELQSSSEIQEHFGSLKRAFATVRRVTGDAEWDAIADCRKQDLLIYLALGRFRRRPPISRLPVSLQRDIRAFFGNYTAAGQQGDALLFQAGDADSIDIACRASPVGKLLPTALYVHRSAVEHLSPLLRVYEGCARAFIGEITDATVVKLHRFSGKVSYLAYPDFDRNAHPALRRGVKVALRSREVFCYDYVDSANPPVLHRKEAMLHESHKLYERFHRLSKQEENAGLLDDASSIGTLEGWNRRLVDRGYLVKGHRLIREAKRPSET